MADTQTAAQKPPPADLPFTCQFCRNTLADHVLVRDFYMQGRFEKRLVELVCGPCGTYALEAAPADYFKAVRLFALTPVALLEGP